MKKTLFLILLLHVATLFSQTQIPINGTTQLSIISVDTSKYFKATGLSSINIQLSTTKGYLKLICEGKITQDWVWYRMRIGNKQTGSLLDTITISGSLNGSYQLMTNSEEYIRIKCISRDSGSVTVYLNGKLYEPLTFLPSSLSTLLNVADTMRYSLPITTKEDTLVCNTGNQDTIKNTSLKYWARRTITCDTGQLQYTWNQINWSTLKQGESYTDPDPFGVPDVGTAFYIRYYPGSITVKYRANLYGK